MTEQSLLVGLATEAKQDALTLKVGEVQATPTANTLLGRLKAIGDALAGVLTARPSTDQDPIFDEANGERVALTANAADDIITPPTGCKFVRISATADTLIATNDPTTMTDNGKNILVTAGQPEIVPVTAGVTVRGLSTAASVVRAMPLKVR